MKTLRPMIGVPCFGAQVFAETALALVNATARRPDLQIMTISSSLLCYARNQLWHTAVTRARKGEITHFVFLDADVAPQDTDWLERMLREQLTHQAAVLGCVVPIKNASGDTGAARETADPWRPENIRRAELGDQPQTWTEDGLLVPTGCLVADVRQAWCARIVFTIADRVTRADEGFDAVAQPEDWSLCRQARALGATIWATTAIRLRHWGPAWW